MAAAGVWTSDDGHLHLTRQKVTVRDDGTVIRETSDLLLVSPKAMVEKSDLILQVFTEVCNPRWGFRQVYWGKVSTTGGSFGGGSGGSGGGGFGGPKLQPFPHYSPSLGNGGRFLGDLVEALGAALQHHPEWGLALGAFAFGVLKGDQVWSRWCDRRAAATAEAAATAAAEAAEAEAAAAALAAAEAASAAAEDEWEELRPEGDGMPSPLLTPERAKVKVALYDQTFEALAAAQEYYAEAQQAEVEAVAAAQRRCWMGTAFTPQQLRLLPPASLRLAAATPLPRHSDAAHRSAAAATGAALLAASQRPGAAFPLPRTAPVNWAAAAPIGPMLVLLFDHRPFTFTAESWELAASAEGRKALLRNWRVPAEHPEGLDLLMETSAGRQELLRYWRQRVAEGPAGAAAYPLLHRRPTDSNAPPLVVLQNMADRAGALEENAGQEGWPALGGDPLALADHLLQVAGLPALQQLTLLLGDEGQRRCWLVRYCGPLWGPPLDAWMATYEGCRKSAVAAAAAKAYPADPAAAEAAAAAAMALLRLRAFPLAAVNVHYQEGWGPHRPYWGDDGSISPPNGLNRWGPLGWGPAESHRTNPTAALPLPVGATGYGAALALLPPSGPGLSQRQVAEALEWLGSQGLHPPLFRQLSLPPQPGLSYYLNFQWTVRQWLYQQQQLGNAYAGPDGHDLGSPPPFYATPEERRQWNESQGNPYRTAVVRSWKTFDRSIAEAQRWLPSDINAPDAHGNRVINGWQVGQARLWLMTVWSLRQALDPAQGALAVTRAAEGAEGAEGTEKAAAAETKGSAPPAAPEAAAGTSRQARRAAERAAAKAKKTAPKGEKGRSGRR